MRLLITGANGFVGRRLTREAVDLGWKVTAVILPGTSSDGLGGTKIIQSSLNLQNEFYPHDGVYAPKKPWMAHVFRGYPHDGVYAPKKPWMAYVFGGRPSNFSDSPPGLALADGIGHPWQAPSEKEMVEIFSRHDLIINLVGNMRGRRHRAYVEANVEYPRRLFSQLARLSKPPRVMHVSSVAAVGPSSEGIIPDETADCRPIGVYGHTKHLGECEILKWVSRVPALIVRSPSVYGPDDTCFLDVFRWASRGYFPKICTRTKRFNLIFRDDLVKMLLSVASQPWPSDNVLHLGSNEQVADEDLAQALEKAFVRKLRRIFLPAGVVRLLARLTGLQELVTGELQLMSPGKVEEMSRPNWVHDFSRFTRMYGRPEVKPLIAGVRETVEWYKKNRWL